jgi:hypothetical protein
MSALATERLIVPISPADKRMVERKASSGKMSTAEFVRRAVQRYDPREGEDREAAELRSMLDVFTALHAETLEQLDRTDAALDAALEYFMAKQRQ